MLHLRTCFSGGHGCAALMVGLNDFKGLFQSKLFCDSMNLLYEIERKGTNENYSKVREILMLALFFFL